MNNQTEVRRAKFEEWAQDEGYDLCRYIGVVDAYVEPTTQNTWAAWQAAIDSVVVELPAMDTNIDYYGYVSLSDVEEAIHAAGIKTK